MKDAWRRERIAHGIVFDRELDMWIEKKKSQRWRRERSAHGIVGRQEASNTLYVCHNDNDACSDYSACYSVFNWWGDYQSVSYTHLTLPTNRCV